MVSNLPPDVNLITSTDLLAARSADVIREYYWDGAKLAFACLVCWFKIDTDLAYRLLDNTRSLADDQNVITFAERLRLDQHLGHGDPVEPVRDLSAVDFFSGGVAAIDIAPFSESGPLIVTVPEPSVENLG